jgi:methanogenic corrinoid protein MtbC1
MIRQEMQRAMQQREAVESVNRDFADPELGPVMKEMGNEMNEAIQRLSRGDADEAYDFVKQQALVYAHNRKMNDGLSQENARLKQQLADAGIRVGAAKAQQDLARGRASITRDVSTRQARPAYEVASEWASKNGVDKSSAQFHQKLRELENQAR